MYQVQKHFLDLNLPRNFSKFFKKSEIKLSGFVFHGQSDAIIDYKATMKLALDNPDYIKWKLWEGVFHEAHNDLEQKEVIKEWIDWMIHKIKTSKVI